MAFIVAALILCLFSAELSCDNKTRINFANASHHAHKVQMAITHHFKNHFLDETGLHWVVF